MLHRITTHQPKCGGFGGLTDIYYISGGFNGWPVATASETRTQAMCGPLAAMPVAGNNSNPKFRFLRSVQTLIFSVSFSQTETVFYLKNFYILIIRKIFKRLFFLITNSANKFVKNSTMLSHFLANFKFRSPWFGLPSFCQSILKGFVHYPKF